MTEFECMWDGHPDRIKVHKTLIELILENFRPVLCATHRAGPRECKLEKKVMYKMLNLRVNGLAETSGAAPIVFAPGNDGSLGFCVN